MTTKLPAPPMLSGRAQSETAQQLPISDAVAPKRRSRMRMLVGALVLVAGAGGTALLVQGAGDRSDVLLLARDVPAGQVVSAQDVRVAAVSSDPALHPVPATQKSSVVGQRAGVDLTAGTLLTRKQLRAASGLRSGESMVAVEVARGGAPVEALERGSRVQVVATPGKGETPAETGSGQKQPDGATGGQVSEDIEARVMRVGRMNASGSTVVHLAVDAADASQVAGRSASGRVALTLDAEG
ncbi:SAF domain-containing protein [Streptomyces cacaoi]|uniref:SAF domain-containing protein n=1 Tax=Streptomyces cacaoi TaxID=1898 RepID=UPI001FD08B8B|nr:SAF domain-containing protein [Streptomyces cacaoi]